MQGFPSKTLPLDIVASLATDWTRDITGQVRHARTMAICDRCDINIDVHRYLFYSSGLITTAISIEAFGVNSEIGLLLLCQRCTETLMTAERFRSTADSSVSLDSFTEIATAWDAAHDVRDAGIIERCRAVGLGPIEATVAAKQQAEVYDKNPDKTLARLHAIRFWNPE